MKIVVCIKQVPDAKDVRLDPETNTLAREGVESIMNPFDRHALEEAVRIKEEHGGEVVARNPLETPDRRELVRGHGKLFDENGVVAVGTIHRNGS